MPTTAQLRVSIAGGAPTYGGVTASFGQTVQLTAASTSGWSSAIWEIYYYPPGFSTPAGWLLDATTGVIYYAPTNPTTIPPSFVLPASGPNNWGKFAFRLRVNNNPLARNEDGTPNVDYVTTLTDESTIIRILSPGSALRGLAYGEEKQFDPKWGWITELDTDIRNLEALFVGSNPGGNDKEIQRNNAGNFAGSKLEYTPGSGVPDLLESGAAVIGLASANSPWGIHGTITHDLVADSNYTVTAAQYANKRIRFTNTAWTVGRQVIFPLPVSGVYSYEKTIVNDTPFVMIVAATSGTTRLLKAGESADFSFAPTGVDRSNRDVFTDLSVFDIRDYGAVLGQDASAAILGADSSAIGAAGGRVYIPPGEWKVSSDILILSTIQFEAGASLSPDVTKTVTITGQVLANEKQQLMEGAGTVLLDNKQTIFWPWYRRDDDGATDLQPAAARIAALVTATGFLDLELPPGAWTWGSGGAVQWLVSIAGGGGVIKVKGHFGQSLITLVGVDAPQKLSIANTQGYTEVIGLSFVGNGNAAQNDCSNVFEIVGAARTKVDVEFYSLRCTADQIGICNITGEFELDAKIVFSKCGVDFTTPGNGGKLTLGGFVDGWRVRLIESGQIKVLGLTGTDKSGTEANPTVWVDGQDASTNTALGDCVLEGAQFGAAAATHGVKIAPPGGNVYMGTLVLKGCSFSGNSMSTAGVSSALTHPIVLEDCDVQASGTAPVIDAQNCRSILVVGSREGANNNPIKIRSGVGAVRVERSLGFPLDVSVAKPARATRRTEAGIEEVYQTAQGTIDLRSLVEAGTLAETVRVAGANVAADDVRGVAQEAAIDGAYFRVALPDQPVTVLNDGVTALTIRDGLRPSETVPGRVMLDSDRHNAIGLATSAAAASLNATLTTVWPFRQPPTWIGGDQAGILLPDVRPRRHSLLTTDSAETVAATYTPPDGTVLSEEVDVIAKRLDTISDFATFRLRAEWMRSGASLIASIGGPEVVYGEPTDGLHRTSGATTWLARLNANGAASEVKVTGEEAKNVQWAIVRRKTELQDGLPTNIAGLILWAEMDSGVAKTGSLIDSVQDQSSANNDFSAAGGERPTWNSSDASFADKPSMSVAGGTRLYTSAFALGPFTLVIAATGLAAAGAYFWSRTDDYDTLYGTDSYTALTQRGGGPTLMVLQLTPTWGTFGVDTGKVLTIVNGGTKATYKLRINGLDTGAAAGGSDVGTGTETKAMGWGARPDGGAPGNFRSPAFLLYNRALTAAELRYAESYLQRKYKL